LLVVRVSYCMAPSDNVKACVYMKTIVGVLLVVASGKLWRPGD